MGDETEEKRFPWGTFWGAVGALGTIVGLIIAFGQSPDQPSGAPSTAPTAAPIFEESIRHGSFCLEDKGGTPYAAACDSSTNHQRWMFSGSGSSTRLKNKATLRCLDSGELDENGRARVYINDCDANPNNYQEWNTFAGGLQDVASQFCLAFDARYNDYNTVYTTKCSGGDDQKWTYQ